MKTKSVLTVTVAALLSWTAQAGQEKLAATVGETRVETIHTREQLQQCRFTRSIAAGDEDQLARKQSEIDRADLKNRVRPFVQVPEHYIAHLDLLEALWRFH